MSKLPSVWWGAGSNLGSSHCKASSLSKQPVSPGLRTAGRTPFLFSLGWTQGRIVFLVCKWYLFAAFYRDGVKETTAAPKLPSMQWGPGSNLGHRQARQNNMLSHWALSPARSTSVFIPQPPSFTCEVKFRYCLSFWGCSCNMPDLGLPHPPSDDSIRATSALLTVVTGRCVLWAVSWASSSEDQPKLTSPRCQPPRRNAEKTLTNVIVACSHVGDDTWILKLKLVIQSAV